MKYHAWYVEAALTWGPNCRPSYGETPRHDTQRTRKGWLFLFFCGMGTSICNDRGMGAGIVAYFECGVFGLEMHNSVLKKRFDCDS